MKVFIIACLAVAALAESDPNLILTNGMYHGLPLATSYINPIVSPISYIQPTVQLKNVEMKDMNMEENVMEEKKVEVEEKKPIVYSTLPTFYNQHIIPQVVSPVVQKVVVPPRYVAKNGAVEHVVAKREADPYMIYSGLAYPGWRSVVSAPHVYSGIVPSVYATNKATFLNPFTGDVTGKVTNDAITSAQYAGKGTVYARAPGTNTVHIAKRDAEPFTYYSNVVSPVHSVVSPFGYAANPLIYSNVVKPIVHSAVVNPIVYNKPLGVEGVENGKTVANDAWQFTPMYAGKGLYDAKTPGSRHIAKRESDPWTTIVRPSYYNYNLGLRTVGTVGTVGYPYRTVASPFYGSYLNYF